MFLGAGNLQAKLIALTYLIGLTILQGKIDPVKMLIIQGIQGFAPVAQADRARDS